MAQPDETEIVPGLEYVVGQWINDFIQDWYAAANAALGVASQPNLEKDDSTGLVGWYVSLGANLMWASTAFIVADPTTAGVLSIVAVLIGSASSYPGGDGRPIVSADQARQMISDRVDELARALETALRKELPTFALEVSLFGIKPPFAGQEDKVQRAKEWLWEKLFHTPYEGRRHGIKTTILAAINSAIDGYERQYRAWRMVIQKCTDDLATPTWDERLLIGLAHSSTLPPKNMAFYREGCIKSNPFTPRLTFKGVSKNIERAAAAYAEKLTSRLLYGLIWSCFEALAKERKPSWEKMRLPP